MILRVSSTQNDSMIWWFLLYTLIIYCTPTSCLQRRCRWLNHTHRYTWANPPAACRGFGRHSYPCVCCSSHPWTTVSTHTRVCRLVHPPHKLEQVILAYSTRVHRHWVIAAYPQSLIHRDIPVSSKHLSLKTHCTWTHTDAGLWALSFSMYECMHAHNLSSLSISMQLLEYMQATTTLHPYVSLYSGLFIPKAYFAFLFICNIFWIYILH